jgi:hypothetical protein
MRGRLILFRETFFALAARAGMNLTLQSPLKRTKEQREETPRCSNITIFVGLEKLFIEQRRHAGQFFSFEEFERSAAAGGDVSHLLGDTRLLDRAG